MARIVAFCDYFDNLPTRAPHKSPKMASLWRPKMSLYRSKKLDIGCFVNTQIIRDHTKRKVFEEYEAER